MDDVEIGPYSIIGDAVNDSRILRNGALRRNQIMLRSRQVDPPRNQRDHSYTQDHITVGIKPGRFEIQRNELDTPVVGTAVGKRSRQVIA